MKRILVISVMFLSGYSINAQNQNCNYQCIIHTIDSLRTALMNGEEVEVPVNYWNFNDLSVEERNKVLDYVEEVLFNQTEYMSFYFLGVRLLGNFFNSLRQSDDQYTKYRMARLHLDKVFYVSRESLSFLGRVADYSEETRERLRNILEGNKTEKDIQARRMLATWDINRSVSFRIDIDNDVNRIMRETDRDDEETRAFLTDSVTAVFIENRIQTMNSVPPFLGRAILRIGSSNDLRFVPGLERQLQADVPPPNSNNARLWEYRINWIREPVIYALAKLGVQPYLDEVLARDEFNFRYLGTREAFLTHLERNFVWNRRCWIPSGGGGASLCAIAVIVDAIGSRGSSHLINIPDEMIRMAMGSMFNFVPPQDLENYDPSQDEQNRERIENIYYIFNWIMENQDVWEIRGQIDYF